MLNHWEPGKSAWENLPPTTTWVVEAHDIDSLLDHAFSDPGFQALLKNLAHKMDAIDIPVEGASEHNLGDLARGLSESYAEVGYLYKTLAPNIIGAGGTGDSGDEIFLYFRPAGWMHWIMDLPSDGADPIRVDSSGTRAYVVSIDGWIVIAETEKQLQDIVDSWGKKFMPFGEGPKRETPYIAFGVQEKGGSYFDNGIAEEEDPADFMMMTNPLAPSPELPSATTGARLWKALFQPSRDGWDAYATGFRNKTDAGKWEGQLLESLPDSSFPIAIVPGTAEAALSVSASSDAWHKALEPLKNKAEAGIAPEKPTRQRLFWIWLWHSWLSKTSGDFLLTAGAPVAKKDADIPPLPVFTLGWTFDGNVEPETAAREFSDSLSLFLDAATGPGGNEFEQAVRESITYQTTASDKGSGGIVTMPYVVANGAKPAWLFPTDKPGAGWLASDPSGLNTAESVRLGTRVQQMNADERRVVARSEWNVSFALLQGTMEIVRERLSLLPETERMPEADVDVLCGMAELFFSAYPRGNFDAAADMGDDRMEIKIRIPFGREPGW